MKDNDLRQRLANIRVALAIQDSMIVANPLPYLKDVSERANELLKVLEDIEYALSPDCVFDFWKDNVNHTMLPRPIDIQGEALIRCNKALDVIKNYRMKK